MINSLNWSLSLHKISFLNHPIITGSLILCTGTGITKLIGFLIRIILANEIGTLELGIYQMVLPLHAFCIAFCGAPFLIIISKEIAARKEIEPNTISSYCIAITKYSLFLSIVTCAFLIFFSNRIATNLFHLSDPFLIHYVAYSLPFASLHICITGYYYGKQTPLLPTISVILEQLVRLSTLYLLCQLIKTPTSGIAFLSTFWGELFSSLFCLFFFFMEHRTQKEHNQLTSIQSKRNLVKKLYLPLASHRMLSTGMMSIEAILLPYCIKNSGLNYDTSLALFGILTGMVLPIIQAPNSITQSISSMLLSALSAEQTLKNYKKIKHQIVTVVSLITTLGVLCMIIFYKFGILIGNLLFQNELCGMYVTRLAVLCPIYALNMLFATILNALEKTIHMTRHAILSLLSRLLLILILVPIFGTDGYVWILILTSALTLLLHGICVFTTLLQYNQA